MKEENNSHKRSLENTQDDLLTSLYVGVHGGWGVFHWSSYVSFHPYNVPSLMDGTQ
jgi:hypothetical protein